MTIVCGSLVVTFAAMRLPGQRFKARPGQKFGSRFPLYTHPENSPQEPKMVPVRVPKEGLVVGCSTCGSDLQEGRWVCLRNLKFI